MTDFYLITGFLGAGKTTLLRNMAGLFAGRRVAVIVNEFGSQGVDGEWLRGLDAVVSQIDGGSIFCSCKLDRFEAALAKVLAEHTPDVLLVEASGLSDPGNIRAILRGRGLEQINYKGSLCVMDAANAHKVLATVQVAKKQLAAAGLVLINKADLADEAALRALERKILDILPNARLRVTRFGNMLPQWLAEAEAPPEADAPALQTRDLGLQKRLVRFGEISRTQLEKFIAMFAGDTHRVKGFVRCTDGLVFVDGVGSEVAIRLYEAGDAPPEGLTVLSGPNLPMRKSLDNAVKWYRGQVAAVE